MNSYIQRRGLSLEETLSESFGIVGQSLQKTQKLVKASTRTVLGFSVVMVLLGLGVSIWIARSISYPIEKLEKAAVDVSRGELPGKIEIRSSGEIAHLIHAFNCMVADLKSQKGQLVERSLLESLVNSTLEGMIMIDLEGEFVVFNSQARRMFGLGDNELNIHQAFEKKMNMVGLDLSLEESRRVGSLVQKEIVLPDNKKQILLCTVFPVKSTGGDFGAAIVLRDITKEKEEEAAKTEFISIVSHELRTPLSIIKEGLSLVLDKIAGDITEKQEKILNTAQDNIARLSRLINNLLDISKIEAGKMELRSAKLEAVALTKQVIAGFEFKAREKNLDLRVNYPAEQIDVFADRDKVIQVLTNLINNSLKFTAQGHIEISARPVGEFIEFTVADTGIGISNIDLERAFGKFQQFGRVAGSGEKGTGLGLSIAKGIVEMHGGKIWVESEPGVGTKFHFTLFKYADDLPLREFVQNRIAAAQKTAEYLSLVTVNFHAIKNSHEHYPAEKQLRHLEMIENLLNADLHRDNDSTFRDAKGCAALIGDCDKTRVNVVCERIKGTISRFMAQEELHGKVDMEIGCATYPDDARNSVDLLKKIRVV
jgi:PAS domain S-box-containing protein